MSSDYAKYMAKMAVGKILLSLGWHSIQTTPLEVLTEILTSYISQIGHLTNEYANQCTYKIMTLFQYNWIALFFFF